MMKIIGTVAVLGTGLLGASLAKALKKRAVAEKVVAWSRSEQTREKCRAFPSVFDEVYDTPNQAVENADLVVICSPTSNIVEVIESIVPSLKNGAFITDVGSVKEVVCQACRKILEDKNAIFVGSHPMAGSEKIGIDFSDPELFEARPCFITPYSDGDERCAKKLAEIWEAVGMKVYSVPPDVHDSIVANISHLPHIVAGALCNTALKFPELDLRNYSGPGFRDSTRISSGNPEIWHCIIADNRKEIVNALKNFSSELNSIIESIENCQSEKIGKFLRDAKAYRDKL